MRNHRKITVIAALFITIALIFAGCDMGNDVESDPAPEEARHKFTVSVVEPDAEASKLKGIEQTEVNLDGPKNLTATTDYEGKAVFDKLKSGTYEYTARKEGYEFYKGKIEIQQTGEDNSIFSSEIIIKQENSAEITPQQVEYNVAQPDDVSTLIEWNEASEVTEVSMIMDREDFEVNKEDFASFNEDTSTLMIKNEFLETKANPGSEIEIFIGFDEGSASILTINVVEKEIKTDAEISPAETEFNLAEPEDVRTTITWNQATELEDLRFNLHEDDYSVENIDDNYTLEDNTLIIYSDFLIEQNYEEGDVLEFLLDFDKGDSAELTVDVIDQKEEEEDDEDEDDEDQPEPGDITVSGNFNFEHNFPHSKVEMSMAGNNSAEMWEVDSSNFAAYKQEKQEELILKLRHKLSESEAADLAKNLGYEKLDYLPELNAMLVKIPAEVSSLQAQTQASREASIKSAHTNNAFKIQDYREPDDEYYYKQWAPPVMRLPRTWRDEDGSSNVRVAILDTGIDYNHVEMQGMVDIDSGINFSNSGDEDDFMDRQNHGTHVAGIVGAKANNGRGVVGVMWDVELLPVKVLNDYGSGSEWSIAEGILHAAGLREESPIPPADVINMSLGMHSDQTPELMEDAVKKAANEGVVIVAASGNSGEEGIAYPAKFEDIIAVGALSENDSGPPQLANYSSYGAEQDITAPGSDIWSTVPGDNIYAMSGTSMAAPQVAGLAGLMISEGIPHSQVLDVMQETAIDLGDPGYNEHYGHGMINTYWGVHEATEITVAVGERDGRNFNIVAENTAEVNSGEFTVNDVPAGEYEVMAWLDVRGSGDLENGDYFASTGKVELAEGEYSFNLTAEEFYQD